MPKVDFLTGRHSQAMMSPGFPGLGYLFHHLPTRGRAGTPSLPLLHAKMSLQWRSFCDRLLLGFTQGCQELRSVSVPIVV